MSNSTDDLTEPTQDNEDQDSNSNSDNNTSDSDSDSDTDYASDASSNSNYDPDKDYSPEETIRLAKKFIARREKRKLKQMKEDFSDEQDPFNFPVDKENWREEDNGELWADGPVSVPDKTGWDPVFADENDWAAAKYNAKKGREVAIAPFYLPYRKSYPVIPNNHTDIADPKGAIEELDRIEEFLTWESFIFQDGTLYEGTVWDDYAHGKGVYIAEEGLVRYEGEWLQNAMEGHGVVEVDIPGVEPAPGSKLEAKMRAEGKIITRDFMTPEDREWLEMDVEDAYRLANGRYEVPFYENKLWKEIFGKKPDKGRYRYAGQWKHGRMHGCGVYEVNEQPIYGRFYFGELSDNSDGCDENVSAMHAGIAEVAAAKARMFINKPDGMVRELRGPYNDPQHPYMYEKEDIWMAPGFIHQFYDVPDYWKTYAKEVDEERMMWLNSYYKSPLRIPMPAELEHWWSKEDDSPEFVVLEKEPEPDPEDPSKLVSTENPVIMHTKTEQIIDFVDDEKYGVRLFWRPLPKEGEDEDDRKDREPEKDFLPLGFDDFYGRETTVKEGKWNGFVTKLENVLSLAFTKLGNWAEEKRKESEIKLKLIEQELEFVEAEICLKEAIEDLETELKKKEKEEDKKMKIDQDSKKIDTSRSIEKDGIISDEDEDEDEEDEEEEDDDVDDKGDGPSSFGSAVSDQDSARNNKKGSKPGKSPFSASSLSFASFSLVTTLSTQLEEDFLSWKKNTRQSQSIAKQSLNSFLNNYVGSLATSSSVSFPRVYCHQNKLKATFQGPQNFHKGNDSCSHLQSLSRLLSRTEASSLRQTNTLEKQVLSGLDHLQFGTDWSSIFFLPIPDSCLGSLVNL